MSQYLLNIASRSAESRVNDLSPSLSGYNISKSEQVEDFVGENNQDSSNQFLQPGIGTLETHIFKNSPKNLELTRADNKEQQENFDPSYFSKYIDRVNKTEDPFQKNNTKNVGNKFNGFDSSNLNVPVSQFLPDIKGNDKQVGERNSEIFTDPVQKNETISKKKNFINPILEMTAIGKDNFIADNFSQVNISPRLPITDNSNLIHNKSASQSTHKLVIGKITVEILPPIKSPAEKIIQRVVQTPARENFSKTNKLSFGLGQL